MTQDNENDHPITEEDEPDDEPYAVDLTEEAGGTGPAPDQGAIQPFGLGEKFNPARYQEWTRIALAGVLSATLVALIVALIVKAGSDTASTNLYRDLAVLVGLIGPVLGFYFAKQSQ